VRCAGVDCIIALTPVSAYLNGYATITCSPNASYSVFANITSDAVVTTIGTIIGDEWIDVTESANTWNNISASNDSWTNVSAGSNTWTSISSDSNSWSNIPAESNTWLKQN